MKKEELKELIEESEDIECEREGPDKVTCKFQKPEELNPKVE